MDYQSGQEKNIGTLSDVYTHCVRQLGGFLFDRTLEVGSWQRTVGNFANCIIANCQLEGCSIINLP